MQNDNPKAVKRTIRKHRLELQRFTANTDSVNRTPIGTKTRKLKRSNSRSSIEPCKSRLHSAHRLSPVGRTTSPPKRFKASASNKNSPSKTVNPTTMAPYFESPLRVRKMIANANEIGPITHQCSGGMRGESARRYESKDE